MAGADPAGGVGEQSGAAGGGTDIVQMELQQLRILVRGGQPDGQRVEGVVTRRRGVGEVPVRQRVTGRFPVGRGGQGDQDVLGVDDQMAHQVPHQPARAAGGAPEVLVGQVVNLRAQGRP